MRNKQLEDILRSQAWERGHSAGEEEVANIYRSLCYDFKDIDALLPLTNDPKFKIGDKVRSIWGNGEELTITNIERRADYYEYAVVSKNGVEVNNITEGSLEKYE